MKIKIILSLCVFFSLSLLGGCNTIGGFGQDVSEAGKAIDNAAGWSQDQINDATTE